MHGLSLNSEVERDRDRTGDPACKLSAIPHGARRFAIVLNLPADTGDLHPGTTTTHCYGF
jgi:hypothetical protein